MHVSFPVPQAVMTVAQAVSAAGGQAICVGGSVRDFFLGIEPKDFDIECHGVSQENLMALLSGLNPDRLDVVGASFGVIKVTLDGMELDVSIPRRDNKVGKGHTGFSVETDPFMGFEAACQRRDLTINAIGIDPLTGEVLDPCGGVQDIKNHTIRVVNPATFVEDSLRALRVLQFVARLGFVVEGKTLTLLEQMELNDLPAERLQEEVKKLLLKGRFFVLAGIVEQATGVLQKSCRVALFNGDVLNSIKKSSAFAGLTQEEQLAVLLAEMVKTNPSLLDTLKIHSLNGVNVRGLVQGMVENQFCIANSTSVRVAAENCNMMLLSVLQMNPALALKAAELNCLNGPVPVLVQGRDLLATPAVCQGRKPGKWMGEALALVREAQLRGNVTTQQEALDFLTGN